MEAFVIYLSALENIDMMKESSMQVHLKNRQDPYPHQGEGKEMEVTKPAKRCDQVHFHHRET